MIATATSPFFSANDALLNVPASISRSNVTFTVALTETPVALSIGRTNKIFGAPVGTPPSVRSPLPASPPASALLLRLLLFEESLSSPHAAAKRTARANKIVRSFINRFILYPGQTVGSSTHVH